MVTSLNKNVNCPHESQVSLDKIFEGSISPLSSDDDYAAELPYITSSGFNQLEFVNQLDTNLIDLE